MLGDQPQADEPQEEQKVTVSYQRGKAKKNALAGSPEDSGLRFDASVPAEEITLTVPELEGDEKDQYELIRYEHTYRLAQNPASYVVLKYRRPVIKRKDVQETSNSAVNNPTTPALITAPAPASVLERSLADVSLLVGLLLDKFLYHLPLYRQHQRMNDAGIMLARSTLTNLVKRTIELLRPIYEAQLESVLLSKVLKRQEFLASYSLIQHLLVGATILKSAPGEHQPTSPPIHRVRPFDPGCTLPARILVPANRSDAPRSSRRENQ